jgi:hypothetical protein
MMIYHCIFTFILCHKSLGQLPCVFNQYDMLPYQGWNIDTFSAYL